MRATTCRPRDRRPRRSCAGGSDARRVLTLFHLGAAEFEGGRLEAAAELLEGAAAIAVEDGREWLLLGCLGRGAALAVADGALRRAEVSAQAALALAERRGWHRGRPAAWAYAALAAAHWHRDELDDVERRADAATAAAYAARDETAVLAIRALRAHVAAAQGDTERARGLMRSVHDAVPGAGPAPGALARGARPRAVGARRAARPDRRGRRLARLAAIRWRRCAASNGSPRATRACIRCCGCTRG